ncbi:MAG: hypothetical protein HRF46_01735 [Acidobacteriota bacterium]
MGRTPPTRPAAGEAGEERTSAPLASSPAGKDAAEVVRALVKAGRSVILYDASNEAVRDFLVEVRQRMEAFLATHQELALQVHPYELLHAGEVVYVERDRERSLALRLYRDGVRRLTFVSGLTWEELSRFISVLGVMFKGIRHQEEDFVTLLWKADLAHVKVEAVAGFRPEDDEVVHRPGEPGRGLKPANETQALIFDAPYEFDHPAPDFRERGQVAWRPLSAEARHRLAREESEEDTPAQCLTLVRELIAAMKDMEDRLEVADVLPLVREIRDFLVASNRLDVLLDMGWILRARLEGEARRDLLLACLDERALAHLLTRAEDQAAVRKAAACLVPEHLDSVLRLAAAGGEGASALPGAALATLLESLGRGQEVVLRAHLSGAQGPLAGVVLAALARLSPDEAAAAAGEVLASGSEEAQSQAVAVLRGLPYGPRVGRALAQALSSGSEEVRLGALQVLAKNRERRVLANLLERLQSSAAAELSAREASALGITLAMVDPQKALESFTAWLKPSGLLQRVASRPLPVQIAAVSGLGRLPGAAAEELLAWAAQHAAPEARERAQALLQRRREAAGGGGGGG